MQVRSTGRRSFEIWRLRRGGTFSFFDFTNAEIMTSSMPSALRRFLQVSFRAPEGVPVTSQRAPRWRRDLGKGAPCVCLGKFVEGDALGLCPHATATQGHFQTSLDGGFKDFRNSGGPSGDAPSASFGALRCATAQFWLRPSETPFGKGYVQELAHDGPSV